MSVPGAGGAPSRGTPPTGRHSPSGTLSSTRGVGSDIVERTEFYYMFYTFVSVIFLQKKRKHHLERERRLRERE